MAKVIGTLGKIGAKSGVSAKGPWTAYSLGVQIAGQKDYAWFRYGFDAPNVAEGSEIEFDAIEEKPGIFKVYGDITVSKAPTANSAASYQSKPSGGSGSGGDERQASIVRQSSNRTANEMASAMLTHDIVKLPVVAKRFDFYMELVDTISDRLFIAGMRPKSLDDVIAASGEASTEEGEEDVPDEAWKPV